MARRLSTEQRRSTLYSDLARQDSCQAGRAVALVIIATNASAYTSSDGVR